MMGRRGPTPTPKGNFNELLESIGVELKAQSVAFSVANPHPELSHLPPEFVFATANQAAYNLDEAISSQMQGTVFLYPGILQDKGWTDFTPLVSLKEQGQGAANWNQLFQRGFMSGYQPAQQGT